MNARQTTLINLALLIKAAHNNNSSRSMFSRGRRFNEDWSIRGINDLYNQEEVPCNYYQAVEHDKNNILIDLLDLMFPEDKLIEYYSELIDLYAPEDWFPDVLLLINDQDDQVEAVIEEEDWDELEEAAKKALKKKEEVKTKSTPQGFESMFKIDLPLYDMLNEAVKSNKDILLKDIKKQIQEEADKLRPVSIKINDAEPVKITGKRHKQFERTFKLLKTLGQVFISGDTGSGKTHLAAQMAEALQLPYASLSLTAGISEAHLLGRMIVDGSYISTRFVELYENGGVFLLDEVDSADANTMLVINSAIANGELNIPNRPEKPLAKRHEDFYLICSANTWGNGSVEYSGREVLDAAFMNRFSMSKVNISYDTSLELQLTSNHEITLKLQKARQALVGTGRYISTRTILDAYKLIQAGFDYEDCLDQLVEDFTEEERNKVMNA